MSKHTTHIVSTSTATRAAPLPQQQPYHGDITKPSPWPRTPRVAHLLVLEELPLQHHATARSLPATAAAIPGVALETARSAHTASLLVMPSTTSATSVSKMFVIGGYVGDGHWADSVLSLELTAPSVNSLSRGEGNFLRVLFVPS